MTIDPRSPDFDPTTLLAELTEATAQFLIAAQRLDDQGMREPSALPDWSRGHLVTHVARNADGLRNLLTWAATGERREMYPGGTRDTQIAEGAARTAAQLNTDLYESSEKFAEAAARITAEQWTTIVERRVGGPQRPPRSRGGGSRRSLSTTSTWTRASPPRTGRLTSPALSWR